MTRILVVALLAGACGFRPAPVVAKDAAFQDAPIDNAGLASDSATCGNGVVEPGEDCEPGMTSACTTSCGGGTKACTSSCNYDSCRVTVTVDPATAWEISADNTTWNATTLPNTNWGCTNCTRYFRMMTCARPTAVDFVWSSDNRAQMRVNGTVAFNTYWLANYCTDAVCCTKCCDNTANCLAHGSAPQKLDATALQLFTTGPNTITWEVDQEGGGSGFYTTMTIRY